MPTYTDVCDRVDVTYFNKSVEPFLSSVNDYFFFFFLSSMQQSIRVPGEMSDR